MICTLHPVLEGQITELARAMHETKMAVIKILIAGMSIISGVVTLGTVI